MDFPKDQVEELKKLFPEIRMAEEGGNTFFLLPDLYLPEGCIPKQVDALFCPTPHSGYPSRLFFAEKISGCPERNWNGNARILDRTWVAISWKIDQNQRLAQMIYSHLNAFRS